MAKRKGLFWQDSTVRQSKGPDIHVSPCVLSKAGVRARGHGWARRGCINRLVGMGTDGRISGKCRSNECKILRAFRRTCQRLLGKWMGKGLLSAPVPDLELMSCVSCDNDNRNGEHVVTFVSARSPTDERSYANEYWLQA